MEVAKSALTRISPKTENTLPELTNKLKLMDYCFKGSYNSAYSGSYITTEMVKYVLSRGCRFIDFEVYYLPVSNEENAGHSAFVGFARAKDAYNPTVSNNQQVTFETILDTVIKNAFITAVGDPYVVHNSGDPLFVHIRLRTTKSSKRDLYDNIQATLNKYVKDTDYYYKNAVSRFTLLSQIMKKIIIVFEGSDYYYIRKNGIEEGDIVNMLSDTESLKRFDYSEMDVTKYNPTPPKTMSETTTDVADFKVLMPDNDVEESQVNPNIFIAIKSYGIQVIMNQYYIPDTNLQNSEIMYADRGMAILPISYCLTYIHNTAGSEYTRTAPEE
jgi:hypothetical protein